MDCLLSLHLLPKSWLGWRMGLNGCISIDDHTFWSRHLTQLDNHVSQVNLFSSSGDDGFTPYLSSNITPTSTKFCSYFISKKMDAIRRKFAIFISPMTLAACICIPGFYHVMERGSISALEQTPFLRSLSPASCFLKDWVPPDIFHPSLPVYYIILISQWICHQISIQNKIAHASTFPPDVRAFIYRCSQQHLLQRAFFLCSDGHCVPVHWFITSLSVPSETILSK